MPHPLDPLRSKGLPALLLVAAASGCGVTQVVDRAGDGRPILIRSPQPDPGDLAALHERHGVRTVLNLRGADPGDGWFEEERVGVEAIGARWEHLDVSGRSAPTPEEVASFFDLVEDPDAWPILMHCQGGIHRTGLFAALYRIQYQGWEPERAVAEMEDLWFDWTTADRSGVKRYLRAYEPDPRRKIDREAEGEAEAASSRSK